MFTLNQQKEISFRSLKYALTSVTSGCCLTISFPLQKHYSPLTYAVENNAKIYVIKNVNYFPKK